MQQSDKQNRFWLEATVLEFIDKSVEDFVRLITYEITVRRKEMK